MMLNFGLMRTFIQSMTGLLLEKLVKQVSTKVVINLLLTCGITILLLIKILESTI